MDNKIELTPEQLSEAKMRAIPLEMARSFSRKVALPGYENMDFFMSLKIATTLGDLDRDSEMLDNLCQLEVYKSMNKAKPKESETSIAARKVEQKDRGKQEAEMDAGRLNAGEDEEIILGELTP